LRGERDDPDERTEQVSRKARQDAKKRNRKNESSIPFASFAPLRETMIPICPLPDALMIPARVKHGRTQRERIASVNAVANPLLGVDYDRGELAWIRTLDGGWLFVTKDPHDTIYHPLTSPLRGRDRYAWLIGPDGIKRGYLTQESLDAGRTIEAPARV
jgi:hypothetical protein